MALNKSSKNTPSSRSGYLSELTASAGKQTNFLLPVRIKLTPSNTIAPLSDGKRNHTKLTQPVLIKDLFQSSKKNKQNSTITSASTQKKKSRSQRNAQPYLNTQSCYKPKNGEDSTLFSRKSCGENKVRRQLYQNLDSPQRSTLEGKENAPKNIRTRVKSTRDFEATTMKSSQIQNKCRKSLLLPPNSIRNSMLRKSGSNFKPPGKQSVKSSTVTVNKPTVNKPKGISRVTEKKNLKKNVQKPIQEVEDDVDMDLDLSSPDVDEHESKQSRHTMRDNFTMTSPIYKDAASSKSISNISKLERPSVIMNNTKVTSPSKSSNNTELPYLEMQNLNISQASYSSQSAEFDFTKVNGLDNNGIIQLKFFLEQSLRACEDQASKLKQALHFVNNLFINTTSTTTTTITTTKTTTAAAPTTTPKNTQTDEKLKIDEKFDMSSNTVVNSEDNSDLTDIIDQSYEKKEIPADVTILAPETSKIEAEEESKHGTSEKLPLPIKILVTDEDLNQEAKEVSSEMLSEMQRLSTIGEVSCEADESNKDDKDVSSNKENISQTTPTTTIITPFWDSPRTPKTPRRRSIAVAESCSQTRRRSARLAAKRRSSSFVSDSDSSDRHDSFTLLESELNVPHEGKKTLPPASKSLPASPMKPPLTPGGLKQWDKRVERPLKEYMALRMNGTFLVTPDVKRFQSCLESSDTPHSRKSLSRKIFMELCDLYAESPEPN